MAEQFTKSIIIQGDIGTIYKLWANFENFPYFMENIKSVTKRPDGTSHWVMEGPLNTTFKWDAETTRLEENKRIAWRSKKDSTIVTSGQVTFTTLPDNEVEITLTLQYAPPAGQFGNAVAKLFADPEKRVDQDLRNFKAFAEQRQH